MEKYVPDLDLDRRAVGMEGVAIDVWINGDGGKATGILNGCNVPGLQSCENNIRSVYEFDVPLPIRPEARYFGHSDHRLLAAARRPTAA